MSSAPTLMDPTNPLVEQAAREAASQHPAELGALQVVDAQQEEIMKDVDDEQTEVVQETWISLKVGWNKQSWDVQIAESDRVYDLKAMLYSLTTVPPERQKILGLVRGALPPEEATIASLSLTSGKKFTLIGTPQGGEFSDPSTLELQDVFNDLDVEVSEEAARAFIHDTRNRRKVREAVEKLQINIMNPPREGKRLLVLDLDYTIVDTKPLASGALPPMECARPELHTFLEAIYPHYDICIWSQTSWMWLEAKLVELGMVDPERNYKISFVLDRTCMFSVFSQKDGKAFRHHVKPLQIIWTKFPSIWGPHNTIHVDDLSRNFALNPHEGLKIHAYKNCHTLSAGEDRELLHLSTYLLHLAQVDDFKTLQGHKHWKKFRSPQV